MYENEVIIGEDKVEVVLGSTHYHIKKEKWTKELQKEFDCCVAYFQRHSQHHLETWPIDHKEAVYQLDTELREIAIKNY